MSRCGSYCLKQLIIPYGMLHDGSGIRQALAREIPDFKRKYPSVRISLRPRIFAEKKITGIYNDGSQCSVDIHKKSAHAILSVMHQMLQTANDEIKYYQSDSLHFAKKSVQGAWSPYLFMAETRRDDEKGLRWDRKLSASEWDHYVRKFSAYWEKDEKEVQVLAASKSKMYAEETEDLRERWQEGISKQMPSDMQDHAEKLKASSSKKVRPKPPNTTEYDLFSSPNYERMGTDAISILRSKQSSQLVRWWNQRKQQLKDP